MQAGDATRAQQQCWESSTKSALFSVERGSVDLQHCQWEELCQPWESQEGCGGCHVHPGFCWDSPFAARAPCSSLGSSPAPWDTVKASSKICGFIVKIKSRTEGII